MSKKTQKRKLEAKQEKLANQDEQNNTNDKSKLEKIVSWVIYAVSAVLIILVIALGVNCHGDAGKIAKKYPSLDVENVFEYLEFDELKTKIDNGDDFHVLLINTTLEDANYYIFCVNQIVLKMQETEEYDLDVVYVFDTYKIKDEETKFFKDIKYNILKTPNLVHYQKTIENYSVLVNSTIFYRIKDYHNNQYYLLMDYFKNQESYQE